VGIAQARFKRIDLDRKLTAWQKVRRLFDRSIEHWKSARVELGHGFDGPALFDQRFGRSGQEKMQELWKELAAREDVVGLTLTASGDAPAKPEWPEHFDTSERTERFVGAWPRRHRNYQDYLTDLTPEHQQELTQNWRELHKQKAVVLGDAPTPAERAALELKLLPEMQELLDKLPGGILSFQHQGRLLGFVHYQMGLAGTLFVEPFPLEPASAPLVSDALYVQYALLKAHELPEVRKVVLLRAGAPIKLTSDAEEEFFRSQGFGIRQVKSGSWARAPGLLS